MRNRQGCLSGILELFLLNWLFDWLNDRFGFGRGASCGGCGCGLIMLLIFLAVACSVITSTNWGNVGF